MNNIKDLNVTYALHSPFIYATGPESTLKFLHLTRLQPNFSRLLVHNDVI